MEAYFFHNQREMVPSKLLEVKFKSASFKLQIVLKKALNSFQAFHIFTSLFSFIYFLGTVLIGYSKLRMWM